MTTTALKPCPFCGDTDAEVLPGYPDGFFVNHRCGWKGFISEMHGYRSLKREDAIAAWNRRAIPPVPAVSEEMVAVATKQIILAMQLREFGREHKNGDFVCSGKQMELLEKCAAKAARAVLTAALAPKKEGE